MVLPNPPLQPRRGRVRVNELTLSIALTSLLISILKQEGFKALNPEEETLPEPSNEIV